MVDEGADVIDVGGESTRPGAAPVPEDLEMKRVLPVIERTRSRISIPISIDTTKARVAWAALEAGADIVNDVTALRGDPAMASVVSEASVPVILMHMSGTPQTMQLSPRYKNVIEEVKGFLWERMGAAEKAGISRSRMVVDPGIGFGKNLDHNLELLKGLKRLTDLGVPLMVGLSRKSFLGAVLAAEVGDRLEGTLGAVVYAMLNGASLIRVHDVKAVKRAVRVVEAILGAGAMAEDGGFPDA